MIWQILKFKQQKGEKIFYMTMANKIYTTRINNVDHRTFGGIIEESDFVTDFSGNSCKSSSIATRIMRDWAFDRQCIKDAENRDRNAEYKKEHE